MTTAGMLIIADSPTSLTLAAGGNAANTFPAFNAADADLALRPILVFRVSPDVSAGNIEIEWTLNGSSVLVTNFTTGVGRSFHEVVNAGVLLAANNILEVEAKNGAGSIEVSDIYLEYRV